MGRSMFDRDMRIPAPTPKERVLYESLGEKGDCGYNSIAACLLENYLGNPSKPISLILAKLIPLFYICYPGSKPGFINSGSLNIAERFQLLKNTYGMRNLVTGFGFVLRQIATTELSEHLEDYAGVYAEGIDLEEMRHSGVQIDETALTALARNLAFGIELSFCEKRKKLPCLLRYQEDADVKVYLHLENQHYSAKIFNKSVFESKSEHVSRLPKPEPLHIDIADEQQIMARIQKQEDAMLAHFEQTKSMLRDMQLSNEVLMKAYIKGLFSSDYLRGRVQCISFERNDEKFMDALEAKKAQKSVADILPQEELRKELEHALARADSIGHIHLSDLLSSILDAEEQDELSNPYSF